MNSRLPPDVDRMLWEVAESQDPKAFDDFELRFPHLVIELGQRIKLVREFRGARRETVTAARAPHFDYREPSTSQSASRLVWAGSGVILAALGFAAFLLTKQAMRPQESPTPIPTVENPLSPPAIPAKKLQTIAPPSSPPYVDKTAPDNAQGYKGPRWDQTQDVKFPHEHLQTVLAAVAYQGGLNIVFAPNTPNPEIAMEYHGMNSVEIIQDLGRKFGFSAMKNGPEDVLIVPARDPNAKDAASSGSGIATDLDAQPPTAATPRLPDGGEKSSPAKAKPDRVGPL